MTDGDCSQRRVSLNGKRASGLSQLRKRLDCPLTLLRTAQSETPPANAGESCSNGGSNERARGEIRQQRHLRSMPRQDR